MGGQGLNIGVQDAVNLAWKLAQVVKRTSPDSLLDIYHAERHPVAARVLRNTMAQVALRRTDDRTKALGGTVSELLGMDEPRRSGSVDRRQIPGNVGASGDRGVTTPAAVLVRPDGYVAWVGDQTQLGLADALTTWFGTPAAA